MTGRTTDRICNQNISHQQKDCPVFQIAEHCRRIADHCRHGKSKHPGRLLRSYTQHIPKLPGNPARDTATTHGHGFHFRPATRTCKGADCHSAGLQLSLNRTFFFIGRIFITRCPHRHGKVCRVQHQMEFAAHDPCQVNLVGFAPKSQPP